MQIKINKVSLTKLHFNHFYLDKNEIKCLSKLMSSNSNNLATFIGLTDQIFLENTKLTGKYHLTLKEIRDKADIELDKYTMTNSNFNIKERSFYISSEINFFTFNEIEKALITDIDDFLLSLNEQYQDIALSRWGYTHDKQSLEQIGERWGITRERIRQLEININKSLINHLRVCPKVLWQHIREKMSENLPKLLINLSSCFESEKEFYDFIELCCEVNSGDLSKIAHPKINIKLLDTYFANNASPIPIDTVINQLVSEFGYSTALAKNTLRELSSSGHISINDNGICPSKIGRREAVAHALADHKNGLPWKDIAKIVNKAGYCSKALNETRSVHDYLSDSDYIYLSDKGTYRHLKYLDLSKIDIQKQMDSLYGYFHKKSDHRFHLIEYYSEMKGFIPPIEYYTLRHIVRTFGNEYGIYFHGKSSVDSLSLDPETPHVTQYDVIINALAHSKHPLTKHEIALKLKSKSMSHAAFYLDKMIENGEVVRIDYTTYTTPDHAFNQIKELPEILNLINSILTSTNKIIEIDVFRQKINIELNLSYSKYFFSALISTRLSEYKWFKVSNLACQIEIPYRNLSDLIRSTCNPSLPDNQNKDIIKNIATITDEVLDRNFYNWKNSNRLDVK
jgi:hypothetical protein